MRVVDGMHRLRVAQLRGDTEVRVQYFDGTEFEAFIRAVQLNVTHGLPLTLADREAAAARIVESSDSWSDRAIARMTGLSAPTVGRIRAHHLPDHPIDTQARIGLDGRVRPLNSVAGRRRASELIDTEPTLSLREIAKRAGISVGTARDVRKRLGRGEDPIPARFLPGPATAPAVATGPHGHPRQPPPRPPQLHGRDLHLEPQQPEERPVTLPDQHRPIPPPLAQPARHQPGETGGLIKSLPAHSKSRIAGMAKYCSRWWAEFADDLEEQQQEYQDIPKTGYRLTR